MTSPSADVVARFPIERTRASEESAPPDEYSRAGKDIVLTPRAANELLRRLANVDAMIDRAANVDAIAAMIRTAIECAAIQLVSR